MEMYKVTNDMSPDIMNEVFKLKNTPHYNLRHTSNISTDPIHSDHNGIKWASYLGPSIWEQIRAEIKNKDSLDGFKKAIKKWKPTECPWRIFKVCVKFRFCLIRIETSLDLRFQDFNFSFNFSFTFFLVFKEHF